MICSASLYEQTSTRRILYEMLFERIPFLMIWLICGKELQF